MGDKICPECGDQFKDTMQQKAERALVIRLLKTINTAGVDEKDEETKDFCFCCWKTALRAMMKPYAEMLGKNAESW